MTQASREARCVVAANNRGAPSDLQSKHDEALLSSPLCLCALMGRERFVDPKFAQTFSRSSHLFLVLLFVAIPRAEHGAQQC